MTQPTSEKPSRRTVLTTALRAASLAALGLLTAGLARKRRRLPRNQTCTNRSICSTCSTYRACTLPPALSRKQTLARESHD